MEALLADQLAVKRSLAWVKQITSQDLGKEKALATLVASKPGEPIADMLAKAKKYWDIEVETPLKRIAKNPAASCAEAEGVFQQYLGLERQHALFGGGDEESLGNLFVSELYNDVRTRCQQEALDECNATGGYDHVFKMALGEERQSVSLGLAADTSWVKKVLAECAIYELHYVSTTQIADAFKLNSVIDGRIKMKPRLEGDGAIQVLANFWLEGEVMSGANPFLVKITCSAPGVSITCSPGGEPKRSAKARIAKPTLKSKEFYVENEQSKQRPVGEDRLELIFAPAMLRGSG